MDKRKSNLVNNYDKNQIFDQIKRGEHPDSFKNERGFTILGKSITQQDHNCLSQLLQFGASPYKIDLTNGPFDPLLETIKRNDVKSALKILSYSNGIKNIEDNNHPIYLAIKNKMFSVVDKIIPYLSLDFINNKNKPILHHMIENMIVLNNDNLSNKYDFLSSDCFFKLIDRGADPNIKYKNLDAAEYASKYWEEVLSGETQKTSSAALAAYSLLEYRTFKSKDFFTRRGSKEKRSSKIL